MLDSIVINNECAALNRWYHTERNSEKVLHPTLSNLFQDCCLIIVAIYIWLLRIWLEYYFEVGYDYSAQ